MPQAPHFEAQAPAEYPEIVAYIADSESDEAGYCKDLTCGVFY